MDEPVFDNAQTDFLAHLKSAIALAEQYETAKLEDLRESIPFLKEANPKRFHPILSSFPKGAKEGNVELACLLLFLLKH